MMDPNDKWVWADQEDFSPRALPLRDNELTPIVQWPDIKPDLSATTNCAIKSDIAPVSTEAAEASEPGSPLELLEIEESTLSEISPSASLDIPPIVAKATIALILHQEDQFEEVIQELQSGLRNGEPDAE